jgi:hypothetical protein
MMGKKIRPKGESVTLTRAVSVLLTLIVTPREWVPVTVAVTVAMLMVSVLTAVEQM